MYIDKYWGNFIGGSDDSLNLVAFLEDQKKEEIPLSEIFAKIGLDKQNWDFRHTVEYLEFTHSNGVEMDFHFAIDVVTDLAAILLECSVSGSVNLHDLDEYNTPSRCIRITATVEEHDAMNKALADFAQNPLEYDLSEMMEDKEIQEMARDVEALRKELYEGSGRNRDYHVKAEDVKALLPDWEGADGCIATNRITVEGRKVGYCYREEPNNDWDSGWRFTAGDESDAYIDDPNNSGIYKLNTICNYDPDIIPLLNTPAPCAFERNENDSFQQIKDWKPNEDEEEFGQPQVYTEEEMEVIEGHIQQYIGKFENVFHELVSPDIHVDICVVPPSEERDYYTLVTMGMGAHRMNVPKELAQYKLERAELAIALPNNWKLDQESMRDERWYWPIRLLKVMARLPVASNTWLGFGHTMDHEEYFAKGTKLCSAILIGPQGTEEGSEVCTLSCGEVVNFYQVIPLYQNEMEYKMEHDADALLEKMAGISFVVNPTRQNAITRGTLCSVEDMDDSIDMDDASYHIESIEEKELPIDPINSCNHMAIYLRWCMEHDLMSEDFLKEYGEIVERLNTNPASVDLRVFIWGELEGLLVSSLFNQKGLAFASYYYGELDSPYFPSDIDNYALEYFGSEQYYSDKFQDEAYLFIPFDENYYQVMAKVIEKRFVNWQGQDINEDTLKPSELAEAMMEYLDCECTYFPAMKDDDPIMSAYSYAKRESVKEGFVPVLIKADDEILWECLIMNSDPDSDGEDDYAFDPDKVAEYRKKMLSAPLKDGKAVLEEMIGQRKEEAEDDDMDWDEEILGEMEGGDDNDRFSIYWDDDTEMTCPLILAKIPVKNPWEIFAYLPFGGWNECPDTPELMAVTKYWCEQYGAVPATMTHDELEFRLPTPIPEDKAMDTAVELYGFCPDVIDQCLEESTVGALADILWQSTVWYFWWD